LLEGVDAAKKAILEGPVVVLYWEKGDQGFENNETVGPINQLVQNTYKGGRKYLKHILSNSQNPEVREGGKRWKKKSHARNGQRRPCPTKHAFTRMGWWREGQGRESPCIVVKIAVQLTWGGLGSSREGRVIPVKETTDQGREYREEKKTRNKYLNTNR